MRICQGCSTVIKRHLSRFHCRTCDANLCVDCAGSSLSNHVQPNQQRQQPASPRGMRKDRPHILGEAIQPISQPLRSTMPVCDRQRSETPDFRGRRGRSTSPGRRTQRNQWPMNDGSEMEHFAQGLVPRGRQRAESAHAHCQRPRSASPRNEMPMANGSDSGNFKGNAMVQDGADRWGGKGGKSFPNARNNFDQQAHSVPSPSMSSRPLGALLPGSALLQCADCEQMAMPFPARPSTPPRLFSPRSSPISAPTASSLSTIPTSTFPTGTLPGQFGNGSSVRMGVSAPHTPRAAASQILAAMSTQSRKKSALRQRSLKGTGIRVSISPSVEHIFVDEDEYAAELCRFSVPHRGDMQSNKKTRTPDTVHCSWCPQGSSCAEHGGRAWRGHMGCPYSIHIPAPLMNAHLMTGASVRCDSPFAPRTVRCDSPFRHRMVANDFQGPQPFAGFALGQQGFMHPPLQQQAQTHMPPPSMLWAPTVSPMSQSPRFVQQALHQHAGSFAPQTQGFRVF